MTRTDTNVQSVGESGKAGSPLSQTAVGPKGFLPESLNEPQGERKQCEHL